MVRAYEKFKFLITLPSKKEVDEALSPQNDVWSSIFREVRRWSLKESNQDKRVWLECIGLLLYGWSLNNLHKIGELWGQVVCCDEPTRGKDDFSLVKILVDTPCFPFINNWIWFILDGVKFKVHVHEVCYDVAQIWTRCGIKHESNGGVKLVSSSLKDLIGDSIEGVTPR